MLAFAQIPAPQHGAIHHPADTWLHFRLSVSEADHFHEQLIFGYSRLDTVLH